MKSKFSINTFKWSYRILVALYLVVLMVLTIYFISGDRSFLQFLCALIFCASTYLFAYFALYRKFFQVVLYGLDPKVGKDALDHISPKTFRAFGNSQLYYDIELLRLNFLLGDLTSAYGSVDLEVVEKLKVPQRFRLETDSRFYNYLVKVHSQEAPSATDVIEQLSAIPAKKGLPSKYIQKHEDYIKMVDQVMVAKEPYDGFEHLSNGTPLDQLMIDYYSAMNHLNQGNEGDARQLFVKISEMNPDLFYVKEAKQYVEELRTNV